MPQDDMKRGIKMKNKNRNIKNLVLTGAALLAILPAANALAAANYESSSQSEVDSMAGDTSASLPAQESSAGGAQSAQTAQTSQTKTQSAMRFKPAGSTAAKKKAQQEEDSTGESAEGSAKDAQGNNTVKQQPDENASGLRTQRPPATNKSMQRDFPNVGTPNPMVHYASYEAVAETLGFKPLVMPKSTGYELMDAYIIGGDTADLRYMSRYGAVDKRTSFIVRTAKSMNYTPESLTGLNGFNWQTILVGNTRVTAAEISDKKFGAFWQSGGYSFAVYGENLNRWDFLGMLTDAFVDITEHYYMDAAITQ